MTQEIHASMYRIEMISVTFTAFPRLRQGIGNDGLMAHVIPPSIKSILTFHAQMPQLFAYLSFPASSPGKRKGDLMALVIPVSIKSILAFHAQMPQLFAYLSFPASSPGKRKGVLMAQAIPPSIKSILTFPCANAAIFSYLSFPASSPGKRKGGLMAQLIPPNIKRLLNFHAQMPQYFPTCPFLPLSQWKGMAAWWRKVDSSQHWNDSEFRCSNAAIVCLPVLSRLFAREEERRLDDTGDSCQHEEDGDELCKAARLLQKQPRRQTINRVLLEIGTNLKCHPTNFCNFKYKKRKI